MKTLTSFPDAERARKPVQTLFGWLLFRRISLPLSIRLARTPVRPAHLTGAGLLAGLAAGGALATGLRGWQLAGAALAMLAKLLDAMDGEVARAKHLDTPAGYVVDGLVDRLRETAVIVGTGIGVARQGDDAASWWTLAAVTGYLAFFYVSAGFPAHWREIRDQRDLDDKHMLRLGSHLRLGAGDTLAVALLVAVLVGHPEWFLWGVAAAAPAAVLLKLVRLFRRRPWEREGQAS